MSELSAIVEVLGRRVEQLAAGDPDATRLIYAIVIALIVIGLALVVLAVWVIRRTRADPELLGPLERMSDPKWRNSDADGRRALLNEVRPGGAATIATPPPPLDAPVSEFPPPSVVPAVVALDEPGGAEVDEVDEALVDAAVPPDTLPDTPPDTEPDAEPDVEPDAEPDVEPDTVTEPQVEAEVEPEPEIVPEPEVDPDRVVESEDAAADDAVAEH